MLQEVIERILVVPIFLLFGLIAPWSDWLQMGWSLLWFGALVLVLRRLPVFLLMKQVLQGFSIKDLMLMGWFGPIGVAALFYSLHINEKHHFNDLWPVVSFVVFASTVVHGFTRYIAAIAYYRKSKNEEKSINHF